MSRLGAMFFPDSHAAMREMLRVAKPGGVLAFAVWHKSELNPFCYVVTNVMDQHIAPTAPDPDAPSAFRFAEPGKLANVMRQAGAIDVEEKIVKFDIAAPISPLEFWNMRSQTSDTLRQKLTQLSEDEQSQIGHEIEQAVQEFFPANQMKFPAQMLIATGRSRINSPEPRFFAASESTSLKSSQMDDLLAARSQMAMSLAFHIIFAAIGIAMPLLMIIAEWKWLRTKDEIYLTLAKRWAKGTAILFAVGAVSGTVLSFELGLLWPGFMGYAGSIIGMPFSLEGFAFFTEAIFLESIFMAGRVYRRARICLRARWLRSVVRCRESSLSSQMHG